MKLGFLLSHPVQYYSPWFCALAKEHDVTVYYAHTQTPTQQSDSGFGVAFDWDIDLLAGYKYKFLDNVSAKPNVNLFSGCDTPGILSEVKHSDYDAFVVMGWYLKSYWQAVWACRQTKTPIFVRGDSQLLTPRSSLRKYLKNFFYPIMLSPFDGFLSVGQRFSQYLKHYQVPSRKIYHVPHFVNNYWFCQEALKVSNLERKQLRYQMFSATVNSIVILFVGKFMPLKRPADIIDALAVLRDKNIDCLAVFIGHGELASALELLASQRNVPCYFGGFQNQKELPKYYALSDVLVLPSDSETWGLVVNEAMACGLPAIVSDSVGCAPDLISSDDTGYIFPCGDVNALAERIEKFLVRKQAGHDFGRAVKDKISQYSVEVGVERTVDAIHSRLTTLASRE